ncbi:hydrogenase nickel incorporation protein [Leptolyngbya sp. Heron Island J]|nr:hydrogenase nickel incorporation protein [Leptolyngbya sp. Heron Island J]
MLDKNDHYAEHNRVLFQHLLVLNILSSPGAGKTTLIQRVLHDCDLIAGADPLYRPQKTVRPGVIVGDLATDRDAERLRQTEQPVIQINTGNLCHLEAESVGKAAQQLDLDHLNLLIIENVGNLICPAVYDLGEDLRIVLMSVTEGEDKPLKYPTMFKSAHVVVITKTDIADVVGFNREEAVSYLRLIAPQAIIFELSATTGEGLTSFYAYLNQALSQHVAKVLV